MLNTALKSRGVRHDIGDPGIQSGLGATTDWETNTNQKASPQGVAVNTKINQVAAPKVDPIIQPFDPDEENDQEEDQDDE